MFGGGEVDVGSMISYRLPFYVLPVAVATGRAIARTLEVMVKLPC